MQHIVYEVKMMLSPYPKITSPYRLQPPYDGGVKREVPVFPANPSGVSSYRLFPALPTPLYRNRRQVRMESPLFVISTLFFLSTMFIVLVCFTTIFGVLGKKFK